MQLMIEVVVGILLTCLVVHAFTEAVLRIWLRGYERAGARKLILAPTKHSARSLKKWLVRRGRHYPVYYPGCKGKPL